MNKRKKKGKYPKQKLIWNTVVMIKKTALTSKHCGAINGLNHLMKDYMGARIYKYLTIQLASKSVNRVLRIWVTKLISYIFSTLFSFTFWV
jgi:hypothetical protein